MKYNYPVKYALMPIYEYISKDEKIISYYIVSKCFIVSENKRYLINGSFKQEYEVVFPYQINDFINNYEYFRCYPKFNIYYDCINSLTVSSVFNDKDEAKNVCLELNKQLLDERYTNVRINGKLQEEVEKICKEYNENVIYYEKIENIIEEELKELEVDSPSNCEDIIIVKENGEFKIFNCSIYDFLEWRRNISYDVLRVSHNEMDIIEKDVESGTNLDLRSFELSKLLVVRNKSIYLIGENPKESIYLIENDKLVKANIQNVLSESSENVVLTTETYEDFIKSYSLKEKIDSSKKYIMKGLH